MNLSTSYLSYISVEELEEEESFVWGAVAELVEGGSEEEMVDGFAMTRGKAREKAAAEKVEKSMEVLRGENTKGLPEKKDPFLQPAYQRESQLADPKVVEGVFECIMDLEVPGVKVKHLMGVSGDLRKLFVEKA
ncbi:hypothetical protein AN958_04008 [Leucoagaricus sp. SymC.cos]|nr:hypothetical protein AN958_04008 [Leucoagaricus sp. SymC.cos]